MLYSTDALQTSVLCNCCNHLSEDVLELRGIIVILLPICSISSIATEIKIEIKNDKYWLC